MPRPIDKDLDIFGKYVKDGSSLAFFNLPLLKPLNISEEMSFDSILNVFEEVVHMQVIIVSHRYSDHAEEAKAQKEYIGVPR